MTQEKPFHSLTDLIGSIALQRGISKILVKEVVDTFLTQVAASTLNGERIIIRGFGSFYLTGHANRTGGINQRVAFKAGTDLRKKPF